MLEDKWKRKDTNGEGQAAERNERRSGNKKNRNKRDTVQAITKGVVRKLV